METVPNLISNSLHLINTLLHEFCFLSFFFDIYPKIGFYCLPTHKRGAHRIFFPWSLLILKSKFWPNVVPWPRCCTKILHKGITSILIIIRNFCLWFEYNGISKQNCLEGPKNIMHLTVSRKSSVSTCFCSWNTK